MSVKQILEVGERLPRDGSVRFNTAGIRIDNYMWGDGEKDIDIEPLSDGLNFVLTVSFDTGDDAVGAGLISITIPLRQLQPMADYLEYMIARSAARGIVSGI